MAYNIGGKPGSVKPASTNGACRAETAGGGVDPVTVMGLTAGQLGDQLRSMIQGAKFALGDVPGGPTGWKRARRPRARSSRR